MAIKYSYGKKDYVLTFTRNSVKQLEATGFNINEIQNKPATMLPMLFYGSFMANHSGIKRKEVDEMFEDTPNIMSLIGALAEEYVNTLSFLQDKEEGNASWEKME